MTSERPLAESRRIARVAGFLYTLVAVVAPVGLFYVPSRLIVAGNASETAARIAAHPGLLGLGMGTALFNQALEVWIMLALFDLFRPVGVQLSRQMLVFGLIPIPMVFLNVLNELAALVQHPGNSFTYHERSTRRSSTA